MPAPKIIFHNFWAKVCSLLLAVMIWHVVNTWQQGGRLERAPVVATGEVTFYRHSITVMKSAGDERAFRVTPATVDVTLKGPVEIMDKLRSGDLMVYINLVDLGDAPPLPLKVMVHHPPGVAVTRVDPPEVHVTRLR